MEVNMLNACTSFNGSLLHVHFIPLADNPLNCKTNERKHYHFHQTFC